MGPDIFIKIFIGHRIFSYVLFSFFFFFKLRGLEHEISKLAIKGIKKRQDILNKSHQLSRYKANNGKNEKRNI